MNHEERPYTSRQRHPGIGKSNYDPNRPSTSTIVRNFHRIKQPVNPKPDPSLSYNILGVPNVKHPTVPVFERSIKRNRPRLSCPESWVEYQNSKEFDGDQVPNLKEGSKTAYSKTFFERNKDHLWQLDHKLANKSPEELSIEISKDFNFTGQMHNLLNKERYYRLSNSDFLKKTIEQEGKFDDVRDIVGPQPDPFSVSFTTTRDMKKSRIEKLFQPAIENADKRFLRGAVHDVDFKNFSNYNSILKLNKHAVLHR